MRQEDQISLQKQLNPAFELGSMYGVSGLPLSWHEENVRNFLGDWDAKPVKPFRVGFRATWLVKAQTPPKSETLTNPDPLGLHVLAVVSPWKPRSRKPDIVLKPVAPKLKKETSAWGASKPAQRLASSSTQRQPPPPVQNIARDQNAPDISESALIAIQSAIAAALAPLQRKINAMDLELQEMGKLPPEVESESEVESGEESDMLVDARSKRPLEKDSSSTVTLRRTRALDRPARAQRR